MGMLALLGFETISLCTTFSIFYGGNIFAYRYLPKGDCRLCCPIEKDKDITFNLFTRKNPSMPEQLYLDEPWTVLNSNFNPHHRTVVFIHGFTERVMGSSGRTIKDAYLEKGEYNVVTVDWGPLAGFPYYAAAAKNTRVVGPHVAHFLMFLNNIGAIDIHDTHVIGFSLGAEVAGFIGKTLGPRVLRRITGLDPAFPLYIFQGTRGHLCKGDARFVDVIHTDGGVFGFPTALGDVDFFPNGGVALQPGCRLTQLTHRGHPDEVLACSHNRAWMYYAESVLEESAFPSVACEDVETYKAGNCSSIHARSAPVHMGFAADPSLKGKYYLDTQEAPPYGKAKRFLAPNAV